MTVFWKLPTPIARYGVCRYCGKDRLQQRFELAANLIAGLHHFLMRKHLVENAGGHVGDAGDRKDFDSHVPRGDDFGDCRHADQVGADGSEVTNFGRRLITGAEQGCIDTIFE